VEFPNDTQSAWVVNKLPTLLGAQDVNSVVILLGAELVGGTWTKAESYFEIEVD